MKKKATLPAGSCFKLGASLIVARREAEWLYALAKQGKRLRRFGYVMQDIQGHLLDASYAKNGVSKTAKDLAQKAADAEFTYVDGTRPAIERGEQFKTKMEDLVAGIKKLETKVSKHCGMGPEIEDEKMRGDLNRLRAKAEKKNG